MPLTMVLGRQIGPITSHIVRVFREVGYIIDAGMHPHFEGGSRIEAAGKQRVQRKQTYEVQEDVGVCLHLDGCALSEACLVLRRKPDLAVMGKPSPMMMVIVGYG